MVLSEQVSVEIDVRLVLSFAVMFIICNVRYHASGSISKTKSLNESRIMSMCSERGDDKRAAIGAFAMESWIALEVNKQTNA